MVSFYSMLQILVLQTRSLPLQKLAVFKIIYDYILRGDISMFDVSRLYGMIYKDNSNHDKSSNTHPLSRHLENIMEKVELS